MALVDIFLVILIISASALCIFVIIYLKKISENVEAARKDIHQLIENTVPVLENLEEVTRRANKIVTEAENYWDELDRSIKNLRAKFTNLTSVQRIRDAQNQATDIIRNIRAFVKGISAFVQEFKHR